MLFTGEYNKYYCQNVLYNNIHSCLNKQKSWFDLYLSYSGRPCPSRPGSSSPTLPYPSGLRARRAARLTSSRPGRRRPRRRPRRRRTPTRAGTTAQAKKSGGRFSICKKKSFYKNLGVFFCVRSKNKIFKKYLTNFFGGQFFPNPQFRDFQALMVRLGFFSTIFFSTTLSHSVIRTHVSRVAPNRDL